jgi:RNA recognition motif-containing protein
MGTRLFVGNLSYSVNEQDLKEAFVAEGIEVRSVKVALDRESGRPRGFAFVETMTDDGAKASIEKLSGRVLQGRSIVIEEAQARPAGPRPGGPPGAPGAPRPGGFGPPRPGGGFGPPGSGPPGPRGPGFGGARPGPGGPGGFGATRPPPPGTAPPSAFGKDKAPRDERRERPEKKRSTRPKPEERQRGNWRWNGRVDDSDD